MLGTPQVSSWSDPHSLVGRLGSLRSVEPARAEQKLGGKALVGWAGLGKELCFLRVGRIEKAS